MACLFAAVAATAQTASAQSFLYSAGSYNGNNTPILQKFSLASSGSMNGGITGSGSSGNFVVQPGPQRFFSGVAAAPAGNVFATLTRNDSSFAHSREISVVSAAGVLTTSTVALSGSAANATLQGLALNPTQNWLYAADSNTVGTSTGLLYRLNAADMSVLSSVAVSGTAAFSPVVNPRTGTVLAFGNSRTAPVFRTFSADLSKSAALTLTLSTTTAFSNLLAAGGFAWAGPDSIYVTDYAANRAYRFNLGGLNADGLYTTGTQDTSFGTGGFVSIPGATTGMAGIATDGQFLYVGSYRGTDYVSRYSLNGSLVQSAYLNTQTNAGGTILYSIDVFTGNGAGVWNVAAGGSWGTVNTGSNWTALGGVPGINQLYTFGDTATFGSALTASGTVSLDGAQPRLGSLSFNNSAASYTLATGTGSGVLTLVAGSAAGSGTAAVTVTAGSHAISAPVTLTSHGLFTVTDAADLLTISSQIAGAAGKGLTKAGAGRLLLEGASTYTGATTISGGTLALGAAGSFANSTTITVGDAGSVGAVLDLTAKTGAFSLGAGQTLGGGGTVRLASSGTLTVPGTFSPGNSPGLFTYDAGTTLLSGTTVMEIFGTSRSTASSHGDGFYDAVNVINGGILDFTGGTLQLQFDSLFADNTTFSLFSPLDTASLAGNFSNVSVLGSFYNDLTWNQTGSVWKSSNTAGGQSLEFDAGTGNLVIVPEPGALALAGLGIAAATALRRRRS